MLPGDPLPDRTRSAQRLAQLAGPRACAGQAPPLAPGRRAESLEKLDRALTERVVQNDATPLGREETAAARHEADTALRRLEAEGPDARLTPREEIMLEAVIEVDGSRPSLPVQDGFVDVDNPMLGDWRDELEMDEAAMRRAIAATGRLIRGGDLSENRVFGTAWVIGPGLVATAQHVLEELYTPHGDGWVERFGGEIAIDFHVEADRPPRPADRIRVIGVERASPDLIRGRLDLGNLDAAVLRLDPNGPDHPPALPLSAKIAPHGEPHIHVVGHPARPFTAADDPSVPIEALTAMTGRIVQLVFGDSFGIKRWSPGELLTGPGMLPEDTNGRVMTHDASTLGGNSGSPVFDLHAAPDLVVGLHYAGRFREANYFHPTARITDHLCLPGATFV
jgi:hypothetical protein